MRWWLFDRLEEYREWREHRKTRALAARLTLTARGYARRTQSRVIVITETPEGYHVNRHRCPANDATLLFHICWEQLLSEYLAKTQREATARIRAGLLN